MTKRNEWEDLKVSENYQINYETFIIRNKNTGKICKIKECKQTGYLQLTIDSKTHLLHRILALQYVPNPNPEIFRVVDHIDRNKKNNNINNLRWVEYSFNSKNLRSNSKELFKWVDELPDDFLQIQNYGKYNFYNLFYSQNNFYVKVGEQYRKLEVRIFRIYPLVNVQNENGKNIPIYLNKFKRIYNFNNLNI
jgi:hypothetical protein